MAYLYIKTKENKKYYYLRKTERKEGKIITKDIFYIGANLDNLNVKEIKKRFNLKNTTNIEKSIELNKFKEISKDKKIKENKFFDKEEIEEINKILIHFKKRKKTIKKEKLITLLINEHSSLDSLDNKKWKLKETENLLQKGISPKNKPLFTIHGRLNTKNILEMLEKEKPKINLNLIELLHYKVMENVLRTNSFRNKEIKIWNSSSKPSKAKNIKEDLKKLLKWFNQNRTKIHPLALAIIFHSKFEKIHPFSEGNGEVGRIIMNYMLDQFDYPWIIIETKNKKEYDEKMKLADKSMKKELLEIDMKYYKPLIDFMHKQFVNTYKKNYL